MRRKLQLDRSEKPGTFYIDERAGERMPVMVVITRFDGSQHVDYPVQYVDGSFGYDFPERIPAEVRAEMKRMFTIRG